jgi:predicted nucleic acid-binding protein
VFTQELIVDTNALSAVADGVPGALKRFNAHEIAVPVIVLGEYRFGISQSRHRTEYDKWLSDLMAVARVLDVNENTATFYSQIRLELQQIGKPIPSNDTWIAALCRQYSYSLMSRDRHFDQVKGLIRIDW